ncbi:carbohydrate-binding protein [Streptomyces abikoensis]|uniref:carbohydrate-binding protein n=1 Tax=Streptomyces abikoensis TaxID=97398 RepID=UPI00167417F2|nr:carbohydrate-binding protein [Streptomyces abikoensis]GGP46097.1 hypothetical protein GCM10010214_18900 [Streptomyces abikoensis]
MNRHRTPLVAALLTVLAALGATAPATGATGATAPDPDAPHRGVVTGARTPDRAPGGSAGRDRAVRAFENGRRARAGTWAHHPPTATGRPAADVTHNWWGIFPRPGSHDGITATHTVDPSYKVSSADDFTYAPTTKAQNSCMEIVTAYWNSGDEIWAWDWCGKGGPAKVLTVDADFLATYTTGTGGGRSYSVQLVRDAASGNRWSSYLYNVRTRSWNLLYQQSGTDQSGLAHGWDMFEIYASVDPATGVGHYCTEARNTVFDSSAIQLRANGAWKPASPADAPWTEDRPDGSAFLCPPLRFVEAGANDHWTVRR